MTDVTGRTGRDGFIMGEALAYAIVALEAVPETRQPLSNMRDMIVLLEHFIPDAEDREQVLGRAKATLTGDGWGAADPNRPLAWSPRVRAHKQQ
jgi:hypothetical protein